MLKKWIPIVLITLFAALLIVIKVNPGLIQRFTTHQKESTPFIKPTTEMHQSGGQNSKHRDPSLPQTFPFGTKEHEDFAKKYPDKFAIVKKMYYSWDYIHNAQGNFSWGHSTVEIKGNFYTNLDKKMNLANQDRILNGKVAESENMLLKGNNVILQLPAQNIYTKLNSKNNELHYMEFSNSYITESEWWQLIYDNYPDWSYKIGTKEGMPVYLIKGVIKSRVSPDLAGPFTMTVSKETGALLDLKCYGKKNKIIFFVSSKNVQINKGIPNENKVFQLDVSGDKQLSFNDFNSRTLGMQAVKGEKQGGVSQ